jgi:hypothetical protein
MSSRFVEITKEGNNYTVNPNGSAPLIETNKEITIDVGTYTDPVEIIPTSPNTAMAKATVTLSNIPHSDITGVYGAAASLYNTSFVFLSDVEITSFEHYTGEETEIEDAIQDTENWGSDSVTFSDNIGNVYNSIVQQTFGESTFIKLTDSLGDIYACGSSDLSSSFSSISKL